MTEQEVGEIASRSSQNVLSMLSNLVENGFNTEVSLDITNMVIKNRASEEEYASLDMCMLDLDSLEGRWIKLRSSTYICIKRW